MRLLFAVKDSFSIKIIHIILLPPLLLLQGCGMFFGSEGYFRDHRDDYLKAEPIAPVKLPAGVKSETMGELFVIPPIPDTNAPMPAEFETPHPASTIALGEQRNNVKIQKLDQRRWIAINEAPGEVWPRVRAFLSEHGFSTTTADPSTGTLETGWLSIKDHPDSKDRYRIRLEPGLRNASTEIHILQTSSTNAMPSDAITWPEQSLNPQREAWMVDQLSAFLAHEEQGQASMLAQAIGTSYPKVILIDQGNKPMLVLKLDYARAWASVGGALDRRGFHVDDMNRDKGQFFVSYSAKKAKAAAREEAAALSNDKEAAPVQEPGIFSRIGNTFGLGDGDPDKPDDTETFRVQLKEDPNQIRVWLTDTQNNPLDRLQADKLLRLIRANLL